MGGNKENITSADDTYLRPTGIPSPRLTITNNNNNRDNARSGTPRDPFSPQPNCQYYQLSDYYGKLFAFAFTN